MDASTIFMYVVSLVTTLAPRNCWNCWTRKTTPLGWEHSYSLAQISEWDFYKKWIRNLEKRECVYRLWSYIIAMIILSQRRTLNTKLTCIIQSLVKCDSKNMSWVFLNSTC